MINQILELLNTEDFYGVSEVIDVAKGRNEYTTNIKKMYKQKVRAKKSK